jgi:acetate kinase
VHLPAALACMQHTMQAWPGVPQLACLDTCFHAQMPALASVLPLPRALRAQGFVRYGFHGLSCESIVRQLAAHGVPHRLLIAHLGQGASVTAVQAGVSIDTSMGATPNGGLVMGSRCGDIDPGTLVLLMRQQGLGAQAMEQLIDQQSGLLGISGLSADLRALHDAAATQPDAQLAVDMFSYLAAKHLAAMAAVLQGVDAIVFTGGIGQHDARVRGAICNRLGFMGVQLDAALNQQGAAGLVSRPASACAVWVLPSLEDEQMALWVPGLCGAVG